MEALGRHKSKQSPILGLIQVTASSILEVVILASVGYLLARRGVIDKKTQTKINKLNVSFFTPALLFSKVAFSLNPARLAELLIVPLGFVIVTLVSTFSAISLAWLFGVKGAKRNFAIACAISPNSNSLPVALMQSLVTTVPQLHWEEEGEPEDTIDGMLGRALTYLVLYSTLGMFLRWSVGAQLLSSVDSEEASAENQEEEQGFGEREVDGNQRGRIGEPSSSSSGNQSRSISSRGGSSSPSSSQDFRQEHSTQQVEEMEEGMGLIGETPVRRSSTSSITKSRANLLRNKSSASTTPTLSIRRSTEDGGTIGKLIDLEDDQAEGSKKKNRSRTGPPSWTKSFPNNVDDDDEEEDGELRGGRNQVDEEWGENQDEQSERVDRLRSDSSFFKRLYQRIKRIFNVLIVKPINAVMSFMTAPLYAAVLSLIVALIPPLQKGVDSIEPLVGALQTAGACSIPLTMVVLGAYFHEEKPPKEAEENKIVTKGSNGNVITTDLNRITEEPSNLSEEDRNRNQTQNQNEHGNIEIRVDDPWRRSSIDSSPSDTSLSSNTLTNSKSTPKRKSWMRNPWASNSNSNIGSEAGDLTDRENSPDLGGEEDTLLNSRHDLASSNSNLNSNQSQSKSKKKKGEKVLTPKQLKSKLENRTILISILSRMFLTPLILIPPLAWYAISTKSNVVDDPVFVCCAVLLIGSPPALTLAQITSQASKSGGGFERLISRTIFVAYAILAAPTTVILVLTALLIAENDHKRGGGPNTIGILNRSW